MPSIDKHSRRCQSAFGKLPGVVDQSIALDWRERQHVEHCARCQTELGNYRTLLRSMQGLRTQILEPAPGALAGILTAVSEKGEQQPVRAILRGRRAAYVGGIAVAAAAGVTGAVIFGRSRAA